MRLDVSLSFLTFYDFHYLCNLTFKKTLTYNLYKYAQWIL